MDFYTQIMKCEKKGIGDRLDSRLKGKTKGLPPLYKDKYGFGFHTSIALLRTGSMPGHSKKKVNELYNEITNTFGVTVGVQYISKDLTHRIFCNYNLPFFDEKYASRCGKQTTTRKENTDLPIKETIFFSPKSTYGICMECGKKFSIDIKTYPANLCVCLECCPNGVSYSEPNHKSETYSHAR